jgi:hypothetical protein
MGGAVGLAWLSAGSGLALCELPVEAFVHDANCFSTLAESGHSEPISNPPVPKDLDGAFALFAPDQLVPEKPGPCPSGETRNVKHLKVERQRPKPYCVHLASSVGWPWGEKPPGEPVEASR